MKQNNLLARNKMNIGDTERLATMAWGALLLVNGMFHIRNFGATVKTLLGGYLLYRGLSGYAQMSEGLEEDFDYEYDEDFEPIVSENPAANIPPAV